MAAIDSTAGADNAATKPATGKNKTSVRDFYAKIIEKKREQKESEDKNVNQ